LLLGFGVFVCGQEFSFGLGGGVEFKLGSWVTEFTAAVGRSDWRFIRYNVASIEA
jgi:hypothetical protein